MKNLGMVRKLDDLGRITLPKELRKTLGIKEKDPVEIYTDNGAICLKPVPKEACEYCGSTHDLVEKNDKYICKGCVADLITRAAKL